MTVNRAGRTPRLTPVVGEPPTTGAATTAGKLEQTSSTEVVAANPDLPPVDDARLRALGIDVTRKEGPAGLGHSRILDVLGPDRFASVPAVRVDGKVAWFNFALARELGFPLDADTMTPELHQKILETLAYRALTPGEDPKGREVVDLFADRYGRRGSGPDFDDEKSAAGNYVIGKPYEEGHYTLGANDLKKKGALGDQYQMMAFSACTSDHYVDDLRQVKGSKSLDILSTKSLLNWDPSAASVLGVLDGVMGGQSINDITTHLEKVTPHDGKNGAWTARGFKDNTYQPGQ